MLGPPTDSKSHSHWCLPSTRLPCNRIYRNKYQGLEQNGEMKFWVGGKSKNIHPKWLVMFRKKKRWSTTDIKRNRAFLCYPNFILTLRRLIIAYEWPNHSEVICRHVQTTGKLDNTWTFKGVPSKPLRDGELTPVKRNHGRHPFEGPGVKLLSVRSISRYWTRHEWPTP